MGPIGIREVAAAVRVLVTGELSRYHTSRVSEVTKFEAELAAKFGSRHALALNSGTSGLICALVGVGVGPGDEVLVPGYTWVSSAAAALAVGAVPVLVEIDDSLTIDPVDAAAKVTPRTRAIVPVHMNNLVCDMDKIMALAEKHSLFVIEDACQAVGLTYRGRRVGTIGHAGVLSFNQHKNLVSGEGGALLTSDERIYARAAMYHDVGSYIRAERTPTDEPLFVGVNFRMPELSAAILRPQLRKLDKSLKRLRKRRTSFLKKLSNSRWPGWSVVPHHDPANAVGIAVRFNDADVATVFGERRGATRLIESGRHVYTNWESILARRTMHPGIDPYAWLGDERTFEEVTLPRTLDVLGRSCTVNPFREVPDLVWRRLASQITDNPPDTAPTPRAQAPLAKPG